MKVADTKVIIDVDLSVVFNRLIVTNQVRKEHKTNIRYTAGNSIIVGDTNILRCSTDKPVRVYDSAMTDISEIQTKHVTLLIKGKDLTPEQMKLVVCGTASYNFHSEEINTYTEDRMQYIGPMRVLEVGFSRMLIDHKHKNKLCVTRGIPTWLKPNGTISYVGTALTKYPSVVDIISDAYELATAFPFLDMTIVAIDKCKTVEMDLDSSLLLMNYESSFKIGLQIKNGKLNFLTPEMSEEIFQ